MLKVEIKMPYPVNQRVPACIYHGAVQLTTRYQVSSNGILKPGHSVCSPLSVPGIGQSQFNGNLRTILSLSVAWDASLVDSLFSSGQHDW